MIAPKETIYALAGVPGGVALAARTDPHIGRVMRLRIMRPNPVSIDYLPCYVAIDSRSKTDMELLRTSQELLTTAGGAVVLNHSDFIRRCFGHYKPAIKVWSEAPLLAEGPARDKMYADALRFNLGYDPKWPCMAKWIDPERNVMISIEQMALD